MALISTISRTWLSAVSASSPIPMSCAQLAAWLPPPRGCPRKPAAAVAAASAGTSGSSFCLSGVPSSRCCSHACRHGQHNTATEVERLVGQQAPPCLMHGLHIDAVHVNRAPIVLYAQDVW
jgi:hypothetical protein